jgi:hypothetical protein
LIARLESLKPDAQPVWGKMNVEQMLSHLVQTGEFPFKATCGDRSNFLSRFVIKPLALYVIPMPKEVKTSPDLDQQQEGRASMGFDVDKANVVETINNLAAIAPDHACLPHPFFGKLSVKQWGLIAHKHIDHHLRQFGV